MKVITIIRVQESEAGTFGVMAIDGDFFCWTLEPPDLLNLPEHSCIPTGRYLCRPEIMVHRQLRTYLVEAMPARTGIFFHPGNLVEETEGCIMPGVKVGDIKGQKAVLDSRLAFAEFMSRMASAPYARLEIKA